jgi:hypothetical protein
MKTLKFFKKFWKFIKQNHYFLKQNHYFFNFRILKIGKPRAQRVLILDINTRC